MKGEKRKSDHNAKRLGERSFRVRLSLRFMISAVVVTAIFGYSNGYYIKSRMNDWLNLGSRESHDTAISPEGHLPPIHLPPGKPSPRVNYTSKHLDPTSNVMSSQLHVNEQQAICESCHLKQIESINASTAQVLESVYEPKGEHLMIDIQNVNKSFLSSENDLASAMLKVVEQSDLTMLSYHCHTLPTVGVSCIGVLMESHIAFHTRAKFGVISLDLFTCGSTSIIPLIPFIKKLFAVPDESIGSDDVKSPNLKWSFKPRGFDLKNEGSQSKDLNDLLGFTQLEKKLVLSKSTSFQKVDVVDVGQYRFQPTFGQTDESNGTGFMPNRILFLDGVQQSSRFGDPAYHEALVHPAMFSVENPKRVAIIGGGEGATLREVLKHKTVEKVVMIEIDEELVRMSTTYLQEWNDCSDLTNSSDSCYNDPRTELYFEDATAWFIQRYLDDAEGEHEGFDVVIMDALDPSSIVEFSDLLYENKSFMQAISNSLGEWGTFVAQVGQSDEWDEEPLSHDPDMAAFFRILEEAEFEGAIEYVEAHGQFGAPWSFLISFKDSEQRTDWYMNQAEFDLEISKRMLKTKSGALPLRYFDGASMMTYQFASRISEESWCLDRPEQCNFGHGFDPEVPNYDINSFEVRISQVAGAGRGTYSKAMIPKGSYLALDECVNGMFVPPLSVNVLNEISDRIDLPFFKTYFHGFIDGYGWFDNFYGLPASGIDSGIMTFLNHGCNGTYNTGTPLDFTEGEISVQNGPEGIYDDMNDFYNPYDERHFPAWGCGRMVALRDIMVGEEILDNYLVFGGGKDVEEWRENLMELKTICMGTGVGLVTNYEKSKRRGDTPQPEGFAT